MITIHEITDGNSTGTYLKQFMENYSDMVFYIDPIYGFRKHMMSAYNIHHIPTSDPEFLIELCDNLIRTTVDDNEQSALRILIDHFEMIEFVDQSQQDSFMEKLEYLMSLNPNVETIITAIGKI
jgi:hypothetical protein